MAKDIITRLKIETEQYENKMKGAQSMLKQFGMEGKTTSGVLGQLDKTFGVSISSLGKMSMAVGAAGTAFKVMKDAMMSNEETFDEWNRIVESAQSVYESFLFSLNGGDNGGFLQRMDEIVRAARAAYDALDELETFNAFNQINTEKTRADFQEAIVNYREGTGTKEQAQAAADAFKKELAERQEYETDAYTKAINNFAASRNVDAELLRKAFSGEYGDYRRLKELGLSGKGVQTVGGGMFGAGQRVEVAIAANEEEKLGQALRQLNDTELQSLQALGAQAYRTGQEITAIDRQLVRVMGGRGRGGSGVGSASKSSASVTGLNGVGDINALTMGTTESMNSLASALSTWQKKLSEATDQFSYNEAKNQVGAIQQKMAAQPGALAAGMSIENFMAKEEGAQAFKQQIEDYIKENPIVLSVDTVKTKQNVEKLQNEWEGVASAVSSVGNAMQGIENPAVRVAGIIAEAIATIALTFAKSLKGTIGPWDWIAGAAAGAATMVATISSIKSATAGGFAEGGIIPGAYNGGYDSTWAHVSPGEVVLNRSQQNNLAAQLSGGGGGGKSYISGEQIVTVINNYGRRTGKGEILRG